MRVERGMRFASGILLCLMFAGGSQAGAQKNEVAVAKNDSLPVNPRSALLRSAVLPGWGQIHNGHPWKAVLFAGAATGFLAGALVEVRSLEEATTAAEQEERSNRRNTRFLYFGLTATLAAIDAFVDAHLAGFDRIGVAPSTDAAYLRLQLRW